jgi:hypothetical protein
MMSNSIQRYFHLDSARSVLDDRIVCVFLVMLAQSNPFAHFMVTN